VADGAFSPAALFDDAKEMEMLAAEVVPELN
jgi:hypothetical protein